MNLRLVLVAALLLAPLAARAETPASDPKAVAVADEVMKALGGRARWDALEGLRWTFEVSVNDTVRNVRRHAWDKHTGWYRGEGKTRTGAPFLFIEQLNDSSGKAWMNNAAMSGDTLPKLMRRARSIWINDSYWLLMPYKLRDPGVTLKYDGEVKDGDKTYDRVAMSFENVGDTPGDRYWISVNRANHRIEKWEHLLQGDKPPATLWTLEGYEEHGGLWFATMHRQGGKNETIIYTRHIEPVEKFGAAEFTSP